MPSLKLLSICSIYMLDFLTKISGYSILFGSLHPRAVPIHEVEIDWKNSVYYMAFIDHANESKLKFRINQILVLDESALISDVRTEIIQGGIGYNFTTLRLTSSQTNESKAAKLTVLIYGLPQSSINSHFGILLQL